MNKLNVTLLGALAVTAVNGPALPFRTDKIRALLVYLLLEGERPHQRQSLAALLWPEMSQELALKNLRQSLHRLQQTLDKHAPGLSADLFTITRQTVQCHPAGLLAVDALTFQALLSAIEAHPHRHLHLCHDCLERLATAAALYHGDLLAGFSLPDAIGFEEWLFFWRERLQQRAVGALGRLAAALAERGETEAALEYANRQAALDPFNEEAHRLIMHLLAGSGQHGKALSHYESCRRLLRDELGVEPAAETTALYRRIGAEQRGETAVAAHLQPAILHHFPVQFTPFIGRDRELQQIEELFLDPACRLLALNGPGGIGKSRLSMRAAERLAARPGFVDDVYFFSLASVTNAEALLAHLLNGLDVIASDRRPPRASLLDQLRERRALLVLDNFEQLIDSAPLLTEMLAAAPGLRLLVTTQLPLNVQAEQRLVIGGLDCPPAGETTANPAAYSAVRLFAEAARQVDAAFRLTAENETAVLQICRLVQGVPLALELAAAWVRVMDCAAIVQEIGRSLDFLSLAPQDRPDRHRSMTAVFAYAWQLLSTQEQKVLGQLAVFRGPFSLEAAMAVTEATPLTLARLLDRSLIQRRQDGRYELHNLLRQFVRQETAGWHEAAARQHCDYYLDLLVAQEKAFYRAQPRQAVAAVQADLDNVRQAWQWAVAQKYATAVTRSLEALGRFYQTAALLPEGEAVFAQAAGSLGPQPRLLVWQAYFLFKLGQSAQAVSLTRQALAHSSADALAQAEAHSLLGELLPREGRFDEAKAYQQQAIAHFRTTADTERLARALRRMALVCWRSGDHEEALRYFQQAIPLHQALDEKRGLAQLYNVLAGIHYEQDNIAQALTYVQQAGALYEAIDDKLDAAIVNANVAQIYTHMGQYDEALAANQRAIEISRELGDRPGLARDLSNRGNILAKLGELDRSLDAYYQALEMAAALGDQGRVAYFQAGIAAVYAAKGDDETALIYFDLALPVLTEQGVPYHLVGPLLDKAELHLRRGELASAQTLGKRAQDLARGAELHSFLWRARILAARLDYLLGREENGRQQLSDLLAEAAEAPQQAEIYYELWRLTGDQAAAQSALAGYKQICQNTPSRVNKNRLAELQKIVDSQLR